MSEEVGPAPPEERRFLGPRRVTSSNFGFNKKHRIIARSASQQPLDLPGGRSAESLPAPSFVQPSSRASTSAASSAQQSSDSESSTSDNDKTAAMPPIIVTSNSTASKVVRRQTSASSLRSPPGGGAMEKDAPPPSGKQPDRWPGKDKKIVRASISLDPSALANLGPEEGNKILSPRAPVKADNALSAPASPSTTTHKRHSSDDSSSSKPEASSAPGSGTVETKKKHKPKLPSLDLSTAGTSTGDKPAKPKKSARSSTSASSAVPGGAPAKKKIGVKKKAKTPRLKAIPEAKSPKSPSTVETPAVSDENSKAEKTASVENSAKKIQETLAVQRERLANAKLLMPGGLKHAATMRLFRSLRTDLVNEVSPLEIPESARGVSQDPTHHTRKRIKRTRSLPSVSSWELRMMAPEVPPREPSPLRQADPKPDSPPAIVIEEEPSNKTQPAGTAAAVGATTPAGAGTPSRRRPSVALEPNAMTAFEWLKTLDLTQQQQPDADDASSDEDALTAENTELANKLRDETWKLIDQLDSSDEDDVNVRSIVSGSSSLGGESDDSSSGFLADNDFDADSENGSPSTPRQRAATIDLSIDAPASPRTLVGRTVHRRMKTPHHDSVASEGDANHLRPKSRPMSMAVPSIPLQADHMSPSGESVNSARRGRPMLVKMNRVADLRSTAQTPRSAPVSRTNSSDTIRSAPLSPAMPEADTISEENGIVFSLRLSRRSRTAVDDPAKAQTESGPGAPSTDSPRDGQRIQKVVLSGTLEALVNLLIARNSRDQRFRNEFLLTFPWFTNCTELLDILSGYYENPDAIIEMDNVAGMKVSRVRDKVVDLIQEWVESHFRYFLIDSDHRERLYKFLQETVGTSHPKPREMMQRIINYKVAGINPNDLCLLITQMKNPRVGLPASRAALFSGTDAVSWIRKTCDGITDTGAIEILTQALRDGFISAHESSESHVSVSAIMAAAGGGHNSVGGVGIVALDFSKSGKYVFGLSKDLELRKTVQMMTPVFLSKPISSSGSRFSGFHPDVFAKQLCLFEQNLFRKVESHEFHFWLKGAKEKRQEMAPNLFDMINFVNKMSSWVATEIVTAANPKQRLGMIKKFILLAQWCLKFKNYQGLLYVMGGLSNTAVSRLSAWNDLSAKYLEMHDKLKQVVSPQQNWKNYRPLIDREDPPCIPYIGLFLADLTFLSDGMPTKLDDGKINWKKMSRIAAILTKITRLQQIVYDFPIHFDVIKFLAEELYALDDKELFTRSRASEPGSTGRARSNSVV